MTWQIQRFKMQLYLIKAYKYSSVSILFPFLFEALQLASLIHDSCGT